MKVYLRIYKEDTKVMGVKTELFSSYVKHTVDEKLRLNEKREKKKIRETIAYCKTKNEFNQAIKEERNKIVALSQLYYELIDIVKKSQNSSIEKNVGKIAMILGLVAPGFGISIVPIGGGIIAFCHGKNNEMKINYKIEIDSLNREIVFIKK